jgi:alanyl-tRNA synthetase
MLNARRVLDVLDLDDGRVGHVLDATLPPGTAVHGVVDWNRRFDHMQQHTGQHVLSACFEDAAGASTVSVHFGAETCTLDLAVPVDAGQVDAAEQLANAIVFEDRAVSVRFVTAEDARSLPLRKAPARSGTLRLVEIDRCDLSACGGTHVRHTGSIGLIAVTGTERFKGGTRVEFVCGGRALARFRYLRDAVSGSVRSLSVLPHELPGAIDRLQEELKAQKAAERLMTDRLAGFEAERLAGRSEAVNGVRLVVDAIEGAGAPRLKALATAIASRPGHMAVLVGTDSPAAIVVARAGDVPVDAAAVLKQLTSAFGGRGGGRPELAQGGGLTGAPDAILQRARTLIAG